VRVIGVLADACSCFLFFLSPNTSRFIWSVNLGNNTINFAQAGIAGDQVACCTFPSDDRAEQPRWNTLTISALLLSSVSKLTVRQRPPHY
jgi:hypothetical protein